MRLLLAISIILPGWLLLGTYVYYETIEYGPDTLAHLFSFNSLIQGVFHLLIFFAPVASTLLGLFFNSRANLLSGLAMQEKRYRDYYHNSPYGYHSSDVNGVIQEVNNTWLQMMGYESSEVVGKLQVSDLVPPAERENFIGAIKFFQDSGLLDNYEVNFVRKDGVIFPVVLSSTAVLGADGKFARSRTVVKDNTQKIAHDMALKKAADDWQNTFNAVPWGVMLLDAQGEVLKYNDYFHRNTDIPPGIVATTHCKSAIASMKVQVASVAPQDVTSMVEFYETSSDEYYRLYGRPVPLNGSGANYIFSMVSISDIKHGEKKILDSRNAFFNMLKDITTTYTELDEVHRSLILVLANAIDAKSPWTKGHSERVTHYSLAIAEEVDLPSKDMAKLRTAALLHDIGKIGTFDRVLDKPEELTLEEYEMVKEHPLKSAQILAPITRMSEIIEIVHHHHERYDGKGYPDELKGEEIPYMARILCIADSYDSMTADRPYRPAQSKLFAIKELQGCAGTHFDPKLVEVFVNLIEQGSV